MLLPALLMNINSTFSTIVDMGSGFFPTNKIVHWLPLGCHLNLTSVLLRRQGWLRFILWDIFGEIIKW